MEGRFNIIGSEFDFNITTTKKLYAELTTMKNEMNEIYKQYYELKQYKDNHDELTLK